MAAVTTPVITLDDSITISIRYDDITEIVDRVIIVNNSPTITLTLVFSPEGKQPITQVYGPNTSKTTNLNPTQQFTIYSKVDAVWSVV